MRRCTWGEMVAGDPLYLAYHDEEWGVPSHDDQHLFEMLSLEGAQAGLSWSTILRKREGYRRAFADFDAAKVARYDHRKLERLLTDSAIVRNRAKIESVVTNARAVPAVQKEFGNLNEYLWSFVGSKSIHNQWTSLKEIPTETQESRAMSKDLKKRGFRFVGPTICYAFMQAVGMVNDHEVTCFRYRQVGRQQK